ncbi:MAG: hypothetical protein ACNA7U_03400 [Candidatus Izemoplasmataceae bacterium]|uniref:hypothetical protein n=1 Tax=Liberiplasma polymorphum TaxID=3374570 RepID=UPI0037741919
MLPIVFNEQLKTRNMLIWLAIFLVVLTLYMMFDFLAFGSLNSMINELGVGLFIVHMLINLTMALLTSIMLSFTQIKLNLTKVEPKGSNTIPVVSFVFALFTFGCTPCVIAFLAAVGIAFTPIIFPYGNLLWKLLLLLFIGLSTIYILYSVHKGTCKAKISNNQA